MLPRWHHNRLTTQEPKPEGLNELTLTFYSEHSEFDAISQTLTQLLAAQGVTLKIQVLDYTRWYQGMHKAISGSAALTFTCHSNSRYLPPSMKCRYYNIV